MRVFIAVDIDKEDIVARLRELEGHLMETRVSMKLVEPENLHITIRFIGEVPNYIVDDIRSHVIARLRFKPFTLRLSGVGAFPSPSNARVVWIGVAQGFEELKAIRDQVDSMLRDIGVALEPEEFSPHVTIARLKERGHPAIVRFLADFANYEAGEQEVNVVRLKKSILTPRGPIYETIAEAKVS